MRSQSVMIVEEKPKNLDLGDFESVHDSHIEDE